MKCLNEIFVDCLISYDVGLQQWTICLTVQTLICSSFGTISC